MARYSLLPSLTSSMGSVPGFGGGLAVVMRPPASRRMAMPAATSLWSVSLYQGVADACRKAWEIRGGVGDGEGGLGGRSPEGEGRVE